MGIKLYDGSLGRNTIHKDINAIYRRYKMQRQRCNNPKNDDYKNYGAKGIKVEYSSREFIGWWLESIKNIKVKKPVCGRIDHSRNYSLDNIEIQSASENSKEARKRNNDLKKRISYDQTRN